MSNQKVRENRLRRMAQRQGLKLAKSKRRDPRAMDYGTYHLFDPYKNEVRHSNPVAGYDGFGLSLDDIERILTES